MVEDCWQWLRIAGSENGKTERARLCCDGLFSVGKKGVLMCLVSPFSKPKIGTESDEYEYTYGHNGTN